MKAFEAAELIDKQVCNLSGGQLQRVLLSMAVADKPKLLLLDEPVSGIDKNGMELFYKTITYLKEHYDLAIILISHDLEYVKKYADHVVLLDKTVLKQGTVKEVFESPEFSSVFAIVEEDRWIHGRSGVVEGAWYSGRNEKTWSNESIAKSDMGRLKTHERKTHQMQSDVKTEHNERKQKGGNKND